MITKSDSFTASSMLLATLKEKFLARYKETSLDLSKALIVFANFFFQ